MCLLAQLEIRVNGVEGSVFHQNLGGAYYFLAHDSGPNARLTSRVTDQIRSSAFQILFSIQATLICLEVEKTLIKSCGLLKFFTTRTKRTRSLRDLGFLLAYTRGPKFACS